MKKYFTITLLIIFSINTFAKDLYLECGEWNLLTSEGVLIPKEWDKDVIYVDLDNLTGTLKWGKTPTAKVKVTMTPDEMILLKYDQYATPYKINRETLVAVANGNSKVGQCEIIEKNNKF
ncbi:hypothetical protein N9C67_01690 [Gammaproteobacteria bacterium]|nr:hypothetical protein [Gammaproteobacteria bacterium]